MANLICYQTGTIVAHISEATERLAGALADASTQSPEGTVVARKGVDGTWDYVRPSERVPADVVVYCE